jgi:hypothetical protein
MKFLIKLFVFLAVFIAFVWPLRMVLPDGFFDFKIHGWGVAILVILTIVDSVVMCYFSIFLGGLLSAPTKVKESLTHVVDLTLGFGSIGASIIAGAYIFPSLISCSSALGPITYFAVMGLAYGLSDLISERLGLGAWKRD